MKSLWARLICMGPSACCSLLRVTARTRIKCLLLRWKGPYRYTEGLDHTESRPLHAELAGLVDLYGVQCMLQFAACDCMHGHGSNAVCCGERAPIYTIVDIENKQNCIKLIFNEKNIHDHVPKLHNVTSPWAPRHPLVRLGGGGL